MYNLNYPPTTLGVQSWRKIICGGTRTKKVEYHWHRWSWRASSGRRPSSSFASPDIIESECRNPEHLRRCCEQPNEPQFIALNLRMWNCFTEGDGKVIPVHAMKAYKRSGGITPLILNRLGRPQRLSGQFRGEKNTSFSYRIPNPGSPSPYHGHCTLSWIFICITTALWRGHYTLTFKVKVKLCVLN
jgi:hypothetical protein